MECVGIPFQPSRCGRRWVAMCALDPTNNVPVTSALVRQLGKQRQYPYPSGRTMLCASHPADYYFWDVLAVTSPELYQLREWKQRL